MNTAAGAGIVSRFRRDGFVVLRNAFAPEPLAAEVSDALADGFSDVAPVNTGTAGNGFQYVPMMGEGTPHSLALLHALAGPAAELLGCPVLPLRAKGTRYFASTDWHRDSELDLPSLGFLAYLEPLHPETGGLRVRLGSHVPPFTDAEEEEDDAGAPSTEPGDLLVMDEHLLHASFGGEVRHQWRVDFFADPQTPDAEAVVREYIAATFVPGWDGGYDVDRFPSFGEHWRQHDEPWGARLEALGLYAAAEAEEAAVREKRS